LGPNYQEKWVALIKEHAPENVQIYVVGLKSDLPRSKETEANVRALLEQYELEASQWFIASSKTGDGVETPFYAAAAKYVCESGSSRPPTDS
jgi:GTPase SAR1 family protein